MLVLSRKSNQSIIIGKDIEIMILDIQKDQIKIGIKAPKEVSVFRKEIYLQIQLQNISASETSNQLQDAEKILKKTGL